MAARVLHYSQVDATRIVFEKPRKNAMGGMSVRAFYNHGSSEAPDLATLIVQTPRMRLPFGLTIAERKGQNGDYLQYLFDAAFSNMETSADMKTFYDKMSALDEYVITTAEKNCDEWFGKKIPRAVLDEFYKPNIKPAKDSKYAPTIRFKVPFRYDKFEIKAFRLVHEGAKPECRPVEVTKENAAEVFRKGAEVEFLVEFSSLWFVSKQFGSNFQAAQVRICDAPTPRLADYAFLDKSEEIEMVTE